MDWNELFTRGLQLENISNDSDEYQIMFSAAVQGIPSAEYCLGLWAVKVKKKPDTGRIWLHRAAQKNYYEAYEALQRLDANIEITDENFTVKPLTTEQSDNTVYEKTSDNNQTSFLDIQPHDFLEAKNALKKYTEQAQKDFELSKVPYEGGLFNLGNHKVTGTELNRITSQIQDYLISINTLNQGLVEEFGQVYKAFESLDKDYISGIVNSIRVTAEVSKKEQQDRSDIKQTVNVLKKFKEDIDQLKHLTDIDNVWELLEKQTKLSKEFSDYMADLSKVKHLKDVDIIYTNLEKLERNFSKVSDLQSKYVAELKAVHEYCDALSKIRHIKDIDKLWDLAESVKKNIENIKTSLDEQRQAISDFHEKLQEIQKSQQQSTDKVNQFIADFQKNFNNHVKELTEAQTTKLNDIDRNYTDTLERLSLEQREKVSSIEKTLANSLNSAVQEQASAIKRIEKIQDEKFEELLVNYASSLERITSEQSSKLEKIYQSLEDEKAVLSEQVNALTKKVKFSYIVAGGTAALAIIQLILNILGVL